MQKDTSVGMYTIASQRCYHIVSIYVYVDQYCSAKQCTRLLTGIISDAVSFAASLNDKDFMCFPIMGR